MVAGEKGGLTESLEPLYAAVAFEVADRCGEATAALRLSSVGEPVSMVY